MTSPCVTAVPTGLKKVTDDMKTHKNPALRQGPAPFKSTAPKPVAAPKPVVPKVAAKPPLTELQNKKWVVVSGFDVDFCGFDWPAGGEC